MAVVVTWLQHLAGRGKPPGPQTRAAWGMRVRDAGLRDGHPGRVSGRLARGGRYTAAPAQTGPAPEAPPSVVAEVGS
ncbi:hypothetical protein ACWEQC_12725 [Streptomyces shenzhenensis]